MPTIEQLIERSAWAEARAAVERELAALPDDHWLLTQLGVTLYEEQRYREALRPLSDALKVMPDCPLALWNLAGTLDALGDHEKAVALYTWLLKSKKTAADDPCWESAEWTDSLKADCVFRLGVCFQRIRRTDSAAHCFRQYANLLLAGTAGTYPLEEAARHLRDLTAPSPNGRRKEVRDAIASTLHDVGVKAVGTGKRQMTRLLAGL